MIEQLPADAPRRTCRRCRVDKFLQTGFKVLASGQYSETCMECLVKKKERSQVKETKEFMRDMDRAQLNMLKAFVSEVRPEQIRSTPHLIELLQETVRVFGGSKGYAQMLMAQLIAAPPGGMVRQKCLDTFFQMVKLCSELSYTHNPSDMSDDGLKQELLEQGTRLGLVTSNGQQLRIPHSRECVGASVG